MADVEADSAFSLIGLAVILVGKVDEAFEYSKVMVEHLLWLMGYSDDPVKAVKEQRPAGRQDLRKFQRYQDLIGKTPLVDITSLVEPKVPGVQVLGKCEFLNPGFSMKDRIVENILNQAESAGLLKAGGTVVAASSGNTGASVSMLCGMRGYKAVITTSPKCSQEKIDTMRAYGATVHISAEGLADKDPGSYMDMAVTMASKYGWFDVNQYDNRDNVDAHYWTMGPEIWEQTDGRVTHFVAGGSTGGTISGTGKFLKEKNPDVKCILADPKGSIFAQYIKSGELTLPERFLVEGVGKGSIPGCLDRKYIDSVIQVSDEKAFSRCHELAKREGLLVGGSAGLNVEAAISLARSSSVKKPAVIVTVLCDLGVKYLSKVYNDAWLSKNNIKVTA